jgi:predicted amidophosphoribosyltransferase
MPRLVLLSLLAGIAGAIVADRKGRSWIVWGLLCWAFPFMLIILVFLRPVLAPGVTKKCPYCAEIIRHDATVCKHCHRELPIELVQCPHCGKFVPERDYCAECNRSLRS